MFKLLLILKNDKLHSRCQFIHFCCMGASLAILQFMIIAHYSFNCIQMMSNCSEDLSVCSSAIFVTSSGLQILCISFAHFSNWFVWICNYLQIFVVKLFTKSVVFYWYYSETLRYFNPFHSFKFYILKRMSPFNVCEDLFLACSFHGHPLQCPL